MRVIEHVPAAPLDRFVRLWSCEAPDLDDVLERSLPTGELAVFINLDEDELRWYDGEPPRAHRNRGAVLGGARTRPYLIDGRGQRHIVGATFIAGGARPFFDAPVDELRGEHIPLDAIWGRSACAIRERLLDAPTAAPRLRMLETILLERRVGPLEREPAVDVALACLTDRTRAWRIAEVRERLGMSATRFIEIFAEHVGLTPKRFARLHRFQRAVAGLETGSHRGLAALAVDCGYSDQAHFIHEFRAFAGVTPTDYVARGSVPTHVRIDRRKIYNPARLGARTIST